MSNTFDILVDTNPMAASVDTVSRSVTGVTGAVVAMQSAVIQAEKNASKKICENVDAGFYILMSSQLSQKMALCSSQISSHLLRMQKFRSDIMAVKNSMQNDYNRISYRYFRIFNSLDKNLEQRVRTLDTYAVKIAKVQENFLMQARDDSATLVVISGDSQISAQKAIIANVKSKAAKAISVMKSEVEEGLEYKENVEHALMDDRVEDFSNKYIPVIICENESVFSKDSFVKNIYIPEKEGLYNFSSVKNTAQNTPFNWQKEASDVSQVKNSFEELIRKEGVDDRVAKEMMRLFEASTWTELEGEDGGAL